jgi:hypothetical protein
MEIVRREPVAVERQGVVIVKLDGEPTRVLPHQMRSGFIGHQKAPDEPGFPGMDSENQVTISASIVRICRDELAQDCGRLSLDG